MDISEFGEISDRVIRYIRSSRVAKAKGIVIEKEWFGLHTEESCPRLVLNLPISRQLCVPILACDRGNPCIADLADSFARDLLIAVPNIWRARTMLCRYAARVRRTTESEIARLNAGGIEISLDRIGFRRTPSSHLTLKSWKEAASHVLAKIFVCGLGMHLKPEIVFKYIEEAEEAAGVLEELVAHQRQLQVERNWLLANGAEAAVDTVTLRHLDRYGLDRLATLESVMELGHRRIEVRKLDGKEGFLSLTKVGATIKSHILERKDFIWFGNRLHDERADRPAVSQDLIGRPLQSLCDDEIYDGMTIIRAVDWGTHVDYRIDQATHFLDFANGGRTWAA